MCFDFIAGYGLNMFVIPSYSILYSIIVQYTSIYFICLDNSSIFFISNGFKRDKVLKCFDFIA